MTSAPARQKPGDLSGETLNDLAWQGRKIWQAELAATSTLRNKFTVTRVLVDPASGSNLRTMEARLGHPSQYVADLEEGTGETAKRSAVPIPELAARGGDRASLVKKANKLVTIGPLAQPKKRGKSYKARNALQLRVAAKTKQKLVVLEGPRSRGIFRVSGGRRSIKLKKLWDLSHRQVTRPKRPTLEATMEKVTHLAPGIAQVAFEKHLRKALAK